MKVQGRFSGFLFLFQSFLFPLFLLGLLVSPSPTQAAEEVFFYHNDAVGSPLAMTDASGTVVWEADYQPFGEEWNLSETKTNDHRFTGKTRDAETGLHYFGARYYDASLGRFLSIDPALILGRPASTLTIPQRHNFYAYSTNNPYRYVDPDGRFLETAFDIVSLGVSISAFYDTPTLANAAALAFDSIAAATPFLPGGAGLTIQAAKTANNATDVRKIGKRATQNANDFFEGTKYTDKVLREMKQGDLHSFPESVKGFQDVGKVSKTKSGDRVARDQLKIPGNYRGRDGNFEFIKEQNGDINHRFFRPSKE